MVEVTRLIEGMAPTIRTPAGPGNNISGIPTTTNPAGGAVPSALSKGTQRDLSIATLLGQAAQAIQPEGVGARLGAFGQQIARSKRFNNAFARMLAGEELSADELQGLGPEELAQLQTLTQQAEATKQSRLKTTQDQRLGDVEARQKALDLLGTAAERGFSDEQLADLGRQVGLDPSSVDFKSATERAIEVEGARAANTIDQIIERGTVQMAVENKKHLDQIAQISARSAARVEEIQAQFGDNPQELAAFSASLRAVATFTNELSTPEEMDRVFDASMTFFGLGEKVGANTTDSPLYSRYLPEGVQVPSETGGEDGGQAMTPEQLLAIAGVPKPDNPYNPALGGDQLTAYMMFQQGVDRAVIGRTLLNNFINRQGIDAVTSAAPVPARSETTGTPSPGAGRAAGGSATGSGPRRVLPGGPTAKTAENPQDIVEAIAGRDAQPRAALRSALTLDAGGPAPRVGVPKAASTKPTSRTSGPRTSRGTKTASAINDSTRPPTNLRTGGNVPQRNNNPGNLKLSAAIKKNFPGVKTDDQGHVVFKSAEDGFKALEQDLRAKITGSTSSKLGARSTLAQLGKVYAEDPNWAKGVAKILGVKTTAKVGDIAIDKGMDEFIKAIATQEGFFAKKRKAN